MNDSTPWNHAMSVLRWGKWVLGALALNHYDALIEDAFWVAVTVIAFALMADRLRTRRLERRWADHCQEIADQWAAHPPATVTTLPRTERRRAAA